MNQQHFKAAFCLLFSGALLFSSCKKEVQPTTTAEQTQAAKIPNPLKNFNRVNLVGNNDEYDPAFVDPGLINAWGLAFTSNGIAWVAAQAGHISAVYNGEGGTVRPHVNIPSPGAPTGGIPQELFSAEALPIL